MHKDKPQQQKKKIEPPPPPSSTDTTESVLLVFGEINKVQTASKAQVFELVRLFRNDPQNFTTTFELAYLKIFKIFHEKANRKMPPKFQQLASSLFAELLAEDDGPAGKLFNYFLNFLAEGIFSSILGIRITSARMMFHLVKQSLPTVTAQTRANVLKSVFFLLRLKVSTYKQVGIKLASLVLGWQHELRDKIEQQLFKILSTEDNEQIRKMALTNMALSSNNIDKILIRLRDKSAEIRTIVLRKLTGEKFKLQDMNACNRLHLLYDGYGNKESAIQQDTLRYFSKFFQVQKQSNFSDLVQFFRPGVLLVYPHMYALFDSLVCGIMEELPVEQLCNFTKQITQELKQLGRGNGGRLVFPQLIWLKNMGKVERSDAKAIFEECVPSGMELAKILLQLLRGRDVWSIHECLQLFTLQKSADEIGRNKMFDSLKKIVTELQYFDVECDWSGLQHDDICPPLREQALFQRKMMLSYFDLPLLSNSYDLLHEAGAAMKALWPDHYEIELKQIMAEWNNPEENTLLVEREQMQMNIKKAEAHGDPRILASLKEKLNEIQEQLLMEGVKTRSIILILSRLRAGISMDDFMPVIKQDLAKRDQSHGLILLGLYCLDEAARVQKFMPLYWMHITAEQRCKLHLLVSIKATTDFMVKFDLTKLAIQNEDPIKVYTHQRHIGKLLEFVLDSDPNVKVLSIETLCRLVYHGRVNEQLLASVFMRLLLLWWQTSSQQVSAKAVHTISIFMRQFIERGQAEVRKLAEALCVFFKVMLLEQSAKKSINKKKVTYNLRMEQFIKRSVVIAMTVLKYHKQSRQVIWKYQDSGAELGPQELFILFLFKHENLHYCLEKALSIVDFYEEAPLETVILMKKQTELILEQRSFANRKNLEAALRKLEKDSEERIQIKNQETFNEQLLNGLRKELREYQLLISQTATKLIEQLQSAEIFTQNPDLFGTVKMEHKDESEEDVEGEIEAVIADIQKAIPIESESQPNRKPARANLGRISEGNQEQGLQESQQKPLRKDNRKGRKREPPIPQQQQEQPNSRQIAAAQRRTRSKNK